MLHLGTLVGMVFVLWPDLVRITGARWHRSATARIDDDPDRRLGWLLLVSVIPAALLGAGLESFFDTFFRAMPIAIAGLVLLGAGALWLGERHGRRQRTLRDLHLRDAVVVGARPGPGPLPGHLPLRHHHRGRSLPGPRAARRRPLRLPHRGADHRRRRALEAALAGWRRGRLPAARACWPAWSARPWQASWL